MERDILRLLAELHKNAERQGPGGKPETLRAMELAQIDRSVPLRIADIGCGTGAASILLAKELDAQITVVDFLPEFLEVLEQRAREQALLERITPLLCSMESLPFADEEFDVIWSEGAAYNIGFERAVSSWRRFLKPGGKMVLSEITWLTKNRPTEIQRHWDSEYGEMGTASEKMAVLERHGFIPVGYFVLPRSCWEENYYQPIEARLEEFLENNRGNAEAREIAALERAEAELYRRFGNHYSYAFYVGIRADS